LLAGRTLHRRAGLTLLHLLAGLTLHRLAGLTLHGLTSVTTHRLARHVLTGLTLPWHRSGSRRSRRLGVEAVLGPAPARDMTSGRSRVVSSTPE